jgi:hypothetical protein
MVRPWPERLALVTFPHTGPADLAYTGLRQTWCVPIQYGDSVAAELLTAVPEFRSHYEEHLRDNNDELLLHPLLADLARFAVDAQRAGDQEGVKRVLAAAERLLADGDESTQELVAVSFVEHLGAETEPGEHEVVAMFPAGLAAELKRQREWRPN